MPANLLAEAGISAAYVRSMLAYEPETGRFIRLASNNQHKVGETAGNLTSEGYVRVVIRGRSYMAHRVAWLLMTGSWPLEIIDHINGDPSDNRWGNLRAANPVQNKANQRVRKDNVLGIKGVRLHESGRYQARIYRKGRHKSLGLFDTAESAAAAYEKAITASFGEFASKG